MEKQTPLAWDYRRLPPLGCFQILVVKHLLSALSFLSYVLEMNPFVFQGWQNGVTDFKLKLSSKPWFPSNPSGRFLNLVRWAPWGRLVLRAVFFQADAPAPLVTCVSGDPAGEPPRHSQMSPKSNWGLFCLWWVVTIGQCQYPELRAWAISLWDGSKLGTLSR